MLEYIKGRNSRGDDRAPGALEIKAASFDPGKYPKVEVPWTGRVNDLWLRVAHAVVGYLAGEARTPVGDIPIRLHIAAIILVIIISGGYASLLRGSARGDVFVLWWAILIAALGGVWILINVVKGGWRMGTFYLICMVAFGMISLLYGNGALSKAVPALWGIINSPFALGAVIIVLVVMIILLVTGRRK